MSVSWSMRQFALVLVCAVFGVPGLTDAAVISRPFEISGWIPYWRAATGTADVLPHLSQLTEVNPFGYNVTPEGRLADIAVLSQEPWVTLKREARAHGVRFIPTVMWSNAEAQQRILNDPEARKLLVRLIVDEVQVNDFDGIDIDFEGKKAETGPHFSKFLQELYRAMGNKWVQCTIEARTPLEDRYWGVSKPKDAGTYANDFAVINKNCDRVRFMTYDQRTVDRKLNEEAGEPYGPVSDTRWVEKAIKEALKTIPKRKVVLGIPTYGNEWEVTTYANNEHAYRLLGHFNPGYGFETAQTYNITPGRNAGGEIGITYLPVESRLSLPRPQSPWPYNLIASAVSALTNAQNTNLSYRMLTWSDAEAIADKVALAKKLGIRGVAVFKFDGGQDPRMWEVLR